MNKHLYRVIFNEKRGQLIVVAENVPAGASQGDGSVSVGSRPGAGAGSRRRVGKLRPLALRFRGIFGIAALFAAPVYGQIIADPHAPGQQRPTVLKTANGVVQVNIQTPSEAGISRNTYTQFDVTRDGVVLNNSRNAVKTELGGWVQGNPWLLSGSARVILNEVNSANPSQLRGYLEVAGQRADIVIANAAGIDVDGAGFINASRVTLTTGAPRFQDGSIQGFLVQQGSITVSGQGIDATQTDYAGILARAVTVNANIWAKDLRIVTGANQFDTTAVATPAEGSNARPAFALDVAQLGGMYAGQITLIGTEAGVGVRNAGTIEATSGNLVLNANGWLTNSGSILVSAAKASTDINTAGDITNSGKLYSAGEMNVASRGDIENAGLIAAQNNTSVQATGTSSRINGGAHSIFASGLMVDGTMLGAGDLSLMATTTVAAHGKALGGAVTQVRGNELDLSGATVTGDQITLTASAGSLDAAGSSIVASGTLFLDAARLVDTGAGTVVAKQLQIDARDWSNVSGEVLQNGSGDTNITLTAPDGTLDNTSGRIAVNSTNLTLGAGTLVNTDGKVEHAGTGTLAIRAKNLNDQRGQILGNGALNVSAGNFDHREAATSATRVDITATILDNRSGHIGQLGAGQGAVMVSGSLANGGGAIESNGDAKVNAATLDNTGGQITALGNVAVSTVTSLNNVEGTVAAGTNLTVQGGDVDNSHGALRAQGGDARLYVDRLNNAYGSVSATGQMETVASDVANSGTLYSGGDQSLTVRGAVVNSGVIAAQGNASISAQSLTSSGGSLLGAGIKGDGSVAQSGELNVKTTGELAAHGQNLAGGQVSLEGASVELSGSQTSGASIALHAHAGDVTTRAATLAAAGMLSITATAAGHGLVNSGGILSGGQIDVQVANFDNAGGTVLQSGSGDSTILASGMLDNTQGRIAANGDNLDIAASTLTNAGGHIEHAGTGTLNITAGALNDERGSMASNGTLALTAGALNHDGATTSAMSLRMRVDSLSNRGGHLLQQGAGGTDLAVTHELDNTGGEIAGGGSFSLQAGAIENSHGSITSRDTAEVRSAGALNNSDGILAAVHSLTVAGQAVDNTRGYVQAGDGHLTLEAASLQNVKGVLSAGTDLNARIGGDLSNDSLLYAGGNQTLNVGGTLANTGSIAAQGDTKITAGSVESGAGSLLAAGIRADGSLAKSGALVVQAAQSLVATGQNLAAGRASLSGSSVDLRGSETSGANISITANSGDVQAGGAIVSTAGSLVVTANRLSTQVLDNMRGTLSAGQLSLNVANLDNTNGSVIQTGVGDANITLNSQSGRLDNTAGYIAANGANLSVGAGTLVNTDGKIEHAGTGTLLIRAGNLVDERGQIASNGLLNISADALDHKSATTSANQIAITAGNLDNAAGHIAQLGAGAGAITVHGDLINSAGSIQSNGDATINTGSLGNSDGAIIALGSASIGVDAGLNNATGFIAAGTRLEVHAGNVDNSRGALQAQGGDMTLHVADLNNAAGSIYAAGKLDTLAANVTNTGTLYAGREQRLLASAVVTNSGTIAAQGNTTLFANSLVSGASGLLGAGVKVDGTLAQAGDLDITTTNGITAYGQNLAAAQVSLQGSTVDLTGSQTGGSNIALHASAGDVTTSGGTVATAGILAITATTEGHGLINEAGNLGGGQLDVQVANIDNRQGTLIQNGSGDTNITLSSANGVLDNTHGRISANSTNLSIGAARIANVDGHIEHAGSGILNIAAGTFNDVRGSVASNGRIAASADELTHDGATMSAVGLSVHASTFSNRGGHLLQSGAGSTALQVGGQLDNTGGEIAGDGALNLQAGSIDNSHGRITSGDAANVISGGQLSNSDGTLAAAHSLGLITGAVDNMRGAIQAGAGALTLDSASLQNSSGVVSAGTDLTARITGNLSNDALMYAGRNQSVAVSGALSNTGSIAAGGDTTIAAASVDSGSVSLLGAGLHTDGSLAQVGTLTVQATGNLVAMGQNLAAGDMAFRGASIDLHGSQTAAANVTLAAGSGDVHTAGALVGTAGTLDVTAGHLDNVHGNLGAGQMFVHVANMDNTSGTMVQTGKGDTDITLSAPNGKLDNTSGQISVNSNNLTLGAGTLVNTDGKIEHAGTGTLAIRAGMLDGERGQIAGNSALDIYATSIDHRAASMSATQIAMTAANLDNTAGHIAQLGTGVAAITVSGGFVNSAGSIESNGGAIVNAGSLDNSAGRLTAADSSTIISGAALTNADGVVAAGVNLTVQATKVDNSRGALQAQGGDATLRVTDLNNADGSIYAAVKLDTVAINVTNTGALYAGGDERLEASGAVTNTGTIAAQGNMTLLANSLASGAQGLLGAGLKTDGALAQTGDLNITTTGGLAAHGQNLAAGTVSLQGASVDLGRSQTGGASVTLRAAGGDVTTSGATVATAGTLAISATTEGHGLVNAGGTLNGNALELQIANLNNQNGTLIQSGSSDASIVMSSSSGTLDNTGGRIAVNGRNLSVGAATLINTGGHIEHAGTGLFEVAAGEINDQHGEVIGNGAIQIATGKLDHRAATTIGQTLTINAGTLDNSDGLIVQKGNAETSISTTSTLNNNGGTIASNGNTTIGARELTNASGTVTSAGLGNLIINVGGNLDNSQGGVLAAARAVGINAGALINQAGKVNAGGTLNIDANGAIENVQGAIVANGGVQLTASQLTNSGGTVASGLGNLSINTASVTSNDGGVIQAAGDLTLASGGLSTAGGSIVGRNIEINSSGQTLNNQGGTIAASQNLLVHSGTLANVGGLVQSGGALELDSGDLDNSKAADYSALHPGTGGGIISGGNALLRVGTWNNAGGFLGVGGIVDAQASGKLDNTLSGQILGASDMGLLASEVDNHGGQIQVVGNLTVKATIGNVNNSGGLMRSGGKLDITAGSVDNSNTQGTGQGLEGHDVLLSAQTLNNDHGAVKADDDAQINTTRSLLNTEGLISAGNDLTAGTPLSALAINNSGGILIGGRSTSVSAASMSGRGQLLSLGDLTLNLAGDFVEAQGTELVANRNLSLKVSGDLSNSGKLSAGANLEIAAGNVANATGAEISSNGTTHVTASGSLYNRGLIDGGATEIDAGTVDNSGTGRIYGGIISIAADSLNNDVENNVAGTIAARARLDIGAGTVNNSEHALIFSAGDLAIGGALDANRLATGRAGSVTNASATIEALGDLSLSAGQVNNLNNHFRTNLREIGSESVTEYSTGAIPGHLSSDEAQVVHAENDQNILLLRVAGTDYETWAHYDFTRTTQQTVIAQSDPGRIAAGGNLTISAAAVLNDNSHILAGGFVGITAALTNTQIQGKRITSEFGTATEMWRIKKKGTDDQGTSSSLYAPPDTIELISVTDSRIEEQTASIGDSAPRKNTTGAVTDSTSSAGRVTANVNTGAIVQVSASADPINGTSGKNASNAVTADGPSGADLGNGSTTTVLLGSASGEHVTVDGTTGKASSAGSLQTNYSDSDILGSVVEGPAKLSSQDKVDPVSELPQKSIGAAAALPVAEANGSQGAGGATLSAAPALGIDPGRSDGAVLASARGIAPSGQAAAPGASQLTLKQEAGGARTVRTSAPSFDLPGTSLFQISPSASTGYLIETDPRFTDYRQWAGSDYMLAQMKLDPALTQKRLGDGFYEQKLLRDQVAQLTGQRFLGDYTSDDEQYRALMDSGVKYGMELNLRPGVALTAEQMAALTKDIVWLVAENVTLADGTVQQVLAPQVYVASHGKDPSGAGAVISGRDVAVTSTSNVTNTGTMFARDTTQIVADNINNLGGRIEADKILAKAHTDINSIGGTISAGHTLIASAGRDINVETTTRSASSSAGGNQFSRTTIAQIGSLSVSGSGGSLVIDAGRDVNLVAAQISNAGKDGKTLLNAGRDLNLGTVTTASSNSIVWDPTRYRKDSSSTELGTVVQAAGAITFNAGNDINLRAVNVDSGGALAAIAGNNLNMLAGVATTAFDEAAKTTKSGFLHHETITTHNTLDATSAIGSVLGGTTVDLSAGRDLKILGSSVVGDNNVSLVAKNAISIEAATDQSHETHYLNIKESGFLSGGGLGFSFGKRETTTNQDQGASTQSGQARSMIGSIAGDVTMNAGDSIKIVGTDLSAGHDISLLGKSVSITPGVDAFNSNYSSKVTQSALNLSLGGSVVNAIQTTQQMQSAAAQVQSPRLKALAAATAAMSGVNAVRDVAANGLNVGVSLSVGHSESEQITTTSSTTHVGSVLTAGNNINIAATGGGLASNIDIVGSDLNAKNNISLAAANQVNLLAAQDLDSQHSQSNSKSAAVGVAATIGTNGGSYGFTASASASHGNEAGEGTAQVNTHMNAGGQLAIASGGDTNLKGAVATANQVIAEVKGNLNIESLQDTAKFDSKNQSVGVNATMGVGTSISGSYNQSTVHNDYASVQEQSGIRVGNGGFQVTVGGNTDLKGGVISSSTAGATSSSLVTATLTQSDIGNHATVNASSVGISDGFKVDRQTGDASSTVDGRPSFFRLQDSPAPTSLSTSGAVVSSKDSGTTRSGVGQGTVVITDDASQHALTGQSAAQAVAGLNRDVITGSDINGQVAKNFDSNRIQSALEITSSFSAVAATAVGDYAATKLKAAADLRDKAAQENDPSIRSDLLKQAEDLTGAWKEDGASRVALHSLVGGLAGGTGGVLGAGATALTTPAIADKISHLDVPDEVKRALIAAAGSAVGDAVGGTSGAVSAVNEVVNNYLNHKRTAFNKPSEEDQYKLAAEACAKGDSNACRTAQSWADLSKQRDQTVTDACTGGSAAACHDAVTLAMNAGNTVTFGSDGRAYIYPLGTPALSVTPGIGAGSFEEQVSKSVSEGLLLDIGGLGSGSFVGAGTKVLQWLSKATTETTQLVSNGTTALSKLTPAASLGASSTTGSNVPLVTDSVLLARTRQAEMLADNVGFNISPADWDVYPTIGRNGTFVSDRQGVMSYFSHAPVGSEVTISPSLASKIELDMGLEPGSLQNGFNVRRVDGLQAMQPSSPMNGNAYFRGPGMHLPSGAPELVVNSIPTVDNAFVKTILKVKVRR
ncbi:MAG: two-partner secretion domain-containing protein [Telluria sp.]